MSATRFRLEIGGATLEGRLNTSKTAAAVAAACPIELQLSRCGDEYYGSCGVAAVAAADARDAMEVGEVAYWPPGQALCIFFGPTPASVGDEPRAASPVNPLGSIDGERSQVIAALAALPGNVAARLTLTD